jgi:hypothetical protein
VERELLPAVMFAHQYDELSPEASAPLSVDYWPFSKKSWPPRAKSATFPTSTFAHRARNVRDGTFRRPAR